ncbi:MAG: DUF488 family protein [Bryobacterales bacterium]|nr:DUF488 family protein [Bryobacterales bacterium]
MPPIRVKRVYEAAEAHDGKRILVDRLWPRGLARPDSGIDLWLKDAAPSSELRRWFGHAPERWVEFQKRYFAELRAQPEAWAPIVAACARGDIVTLLFAARDTERNNAVALRAFLERSAARGG